MQRQYCREYAKKHLDWEIIEEKIEKGVSGYMLSPDERDAIIELKSKAEAKAFDVLLVYMSDRIGRIADESSMCTSWFIEQGIEIWSATEGQIVLNTQMDRLMNYLRFWTAEGESRKTSVRTRTRLEQIVQEGRFRGGIPSYGYRLEKHGRINVRGHEVNEIVIDENEAITVRYIFELSAYNGYGCHKIAGILKREGYRNRQGQAFHPSTIQNMLKNIMYVGILRSGKSRSEIFPHLQIIKPEVFELVQKQIEYHRSDYEKSRLSPMRSTGQTLLSGIAFCRHCGARLNGTTVRKNHHKVKGDNPRVPAYRCYNRISHKERCDGQTTYRAEKVDSVVNDVVCEVLRRIKLTPEKQYLEQRQQQELTVLRSHMKKLEKSYTNAADERKKLARHMGEALEGKGPFSAEDLKEQMDLLKDECERIAQQMDEQRMLLCKKECQERSIAQQFAMLKDYAMIYENADMEEKRLIVAALIEKVLVSRGYEIEIHFRIGIDLLEDS